MDNKKYTQAYIYDLLAQANKADAGYDVFGASKHKYKLAPPATIDEIRALEEEFNIKFPEEFVYFYTEIGNGGAGPYYGLYSLDELRKHQYCRKQNDILMPLIDAGLTKEAWYDLMEQMESGDDDNYDEIEQQVNAGVFIIGTQGCTFDNLLMCKGSETGKIVYIDWNLEGENPPILTGISFMEWYVGFFEDIIAGYSVRGYGYNKRCSEQQLIADYRNSLTYEDKMANLRGFMRFDKLSDETIDFLYHTQDMETDSARLELLLKYNTDLAMKLFDLYINGENVAAAVSVIRRIPKEQYQLYYKRAIEILYEEHKCDIDTLLFFIGDQANKRASDIIEFARQLPSDNKFKSTAIYVLGTCQDAMIYEEDFIKWMKGDNYRVARTALQAAISSNHRSYALMEAFRWMGEKYKTDSVMRSNLRKVL